MSFLQYNIRLVLGGTQTGNSDKQFPIFAIMLSSKEPSLYAAVRSSPYRSEIRKVSEDDNHE